MGQNESRGPLRDGNRVAADTIDEFDRDCSSKQTMKITCSSIKLTQDSELAVASPSVKTLLVDDKATATSQVRHYGTLTSSTYEDQLLATSESQRQHQRRQMNAASRGGQISRRGWAGSSNSMAIGSGQSWSSGNGGQFHHCSCHCTTCDHQYCHRVSTTCESQYQQAAAAGGAWPIARESEQYHHAPIGYCHPLECGAHSTAPSGLSAAAATIDEQHDELAAACCHKSAYSSSSSRGAASAGWLREVNPISPQREAGNKVANYLLNGAQQVQPQQEQQQQHKYRRQRHLRGSPAALSDRRGITIGSTNCDDPNYECNRPERETASHLAELSRPLYRPPSEPFGRVGRSGGSGGDTNASPLTVSSAVSLSASSSAASLLVALNGTKSPQKRRLNRQQSPPPSSRITADSHGPTASATLCRRSPATPPPIGNQLAAEGSLRAQHGLNNVGDIKTVTANDETVPTSAGGGDIKCKSTNTDNEGARVSATQNNTTLASSDAQLKRSSPIETPRSTQTIDEAEATAAAATTTTTTRNDSTAATASASGKQTGVENKNLTGNNCGPKRSSASLVGQSAAFRGHLAWNDLAAKYGRMSRKQSSSQLVGSIKSGATGDGGGNGNGNDDSTSADHNSHSSAGSSVQPARRSNSARLSNSSCLIHIICALLHTLFPILDSLKNYTLPGDLLTDLAAGFTVAVLHIPQGMAYGLLSGVEPIYGLYVSFIPVLVMSLMSKSRHVSYGTFAVISMLLVTTVENVRANFDAATAAAHHGGADLVALNASDSSNFVGHNHATRLSPLLPEAVVITDNHQPAAAPLSSASGDLIANSNHQHQHQEFGADSMSSLSVMISPAPSNIEILACACLICGLVHITMSLMHLGVLSLMFSDQLVSSFTTASAIHVLTSQLAGLCDLSLPPIQEELFKIARIWYSFVHTILFTGCNQLTALLSLSSIAFLLLVKQLIEPKLKRRFARPICLPSELVLMSAMITCSWYFKFQSQHGVKIIGHVPTGLPEAKVARLDLVPYVIKDSITIALISFAMNLSIAQVYAKKFRYELNANQELFALGTANIVGSFFNCFPCASSLSRSSVQSNLNVRSQLCSLFSCGLVVLIICFFAHILHDLPRSTLSCIIVVALKGILMQVTDLYDNWRLSKLDALVWLATFLSVIIFGVLYGLILGIIASLFTIFLRLLTPNHSILGRLPGTDIYVDVNEFANCQEINGIKIFRFNSALCYLNRTMLRSKIKQLLPSVYKPTGFSAICAQFHHQYNTSSQSPLYTDNTSIDSNGHRTAPAQSDINYLIIDCSALSYCDYSGATTLVELVEDMKHERVTVYLAACPMKLIGMLERMKSTGKVLDENVYPTISDAIGQVRYLNHLVSGSQMAPISCDSSGPNEKNLASSPTLSSSSPSLSSSSLKRRPTGDKVVVSVPSQQRDNSDKDKSANSLSSILDVP